MLRSEPRQLHSLLPRPVIGCTRFWAVFKDLVSEAATTKSPSRKILSVGNFRMRAMYSLRSDRAGTITDKL